MEINKILGWVNLHSLTFRQKITDNKTNFILMILISPEFYSAIETRHVYKASRSILDKRLHVVWIGNSHIPGYLLCFQSTNIYKGGNSIISLYYIHLMTFLQVTREET